MEAMELNQLIVLEQGVEPAEVAANSTCCKTGEGRLLTE